MLVHLLNATHRECQPQREKKTTAIQSSQQMQTFCAKRKSVVAFRLVGQCVLLVLRATAKYMHLFYDAQVFTLL